MAFNTLTKIRAAFTPSAPIAPTAAEKALAERDRSYKAYRRAVLADREKLFSLTPEGDLLRKFGKTLAHFKSYEEGRMVIYVHDQCKGWLRNAEEKYRIEALRMIGEQCQRNRMRSGKPPLDDPMPEQPDDAFRLCKRELGL